MFSTSLWFESRRGLRIGRRLGRRMAKERRNNGQSALYFHWSLQCLEHPSERMSTGTIPPSCTYLIHAINSAPCGLAVSWRMPTLPHDRRPRRRLEGGRRGRAAGRNGRSRAQGGALSSSRHRCRTRPSRRILFAKRGNSTGRVQILGHEFADIAGAASKYGLGGIKCHTNTGATSICGGMTSSIRLVMTSRSAGQVGRASRVPPHLGLRDPFVQSRSKHIIEPNCEADDYSGMSPGQRWEC